MCINLDPLPMLLGLIPIWGHLCTGVKRSFSLKMLYLVHDIAWPYIYSNFNISISFKPSIAFAGSTGNLGSVRGRSLKAGRIRRLWRQQCLVLLSFFLSFFLFFCFYPAGAAAGSCFLLVSSSYTVAVCDCVFLLYDFFLLLLSTLQSLISPTWLDRFWPDLVTSTGWPSHLCHMTRLGSKVT